MIGTSKVWDTGAVCSVGIIKMNELDELAQEAMRKVACSQCEGKGAHTGLINEETRNWSTCEDCQGTGEILDPQLANLRMVLWMEGCPCDEVPNCRACVTASTPKPPPGEKNWGPLAAIHTVPIALGLRTSDTKHAKRCRWCKGTGYVRLDMGGWPKGALAGTLLFAVASWEGRLSSNIMDCFDRHDVDPAAVSVMLAAVKAKA